jgi:hypothetical protein
MNLSRLNATITSRVQHLHGVLFMVYAAGSAFCLYTCIFALRKAFGVGTYEGMDVAGLSFKSWMVILQVLGYMLSKFIGPFSFSHVFS